MTRFWITLDQGINFVLSSLAMMRGGEIFIPKISSMKISDMASAMAPGIAQHTIGIRPGEKLHETMITPDDARMTLELDDRYIIKPSFQFWGEESFSFEGAKPVPNKFSYSSDANSEWLEADDFMRLIE
jgi:UDP-N-acetylglucosamine 4,6-dehydratase